MEKYSAEFLREIIDTWQPSAETPITISDADEIADNTLNLLSFLDELNIKYAEKLLKNRNKSD